MHPETQTAELRKAERGILVFVPRLYRTGDAIPRDDLEFVTQYPRVKSKHGMPNLEGGSRRVATTCTL